MAEQDAKWGIVSTIKADAAAILDFAAFHLEAGAHRLFLYLDAPCPDAYPLLKAHPKIRVTECDEAYWRRRGRRPEKHQLRQTANATRAYRRQARDVDWLMHCDVDEFLWAQPDAAKQLAALPRTVSCVRVRPIESLSGGDGCAFKRPLSKLDKDIKPEHVYPEFGGHLDGGFLSHLHGKVFVRTGMEDIELRIHNAFQRKRKNPDLAEAAGMDLCHLHARNWDSWLSHYRYRLEHGSYRAELKPAFPREAGGVTVHELLSAIEGEMGETGLRAFFAEVCEDSPDLRARLTAGGLLEIRPLGLEEKRQKHFPGFS